MSSLSIEQIIKIVIGVLVLVTVLAGVYMVFEGRINSFFGDVVPQHEPDLETPYYKELMKEGNIVASVPVNDDNAFITLLPSGQKTEYYIPKGSTKIKREVKFAGEMSWRAIFGVDEQVGEIAGNGKIVIFEKFAERGELKHISGGEKIGGGIFKL